VTNYPVYDVNPGVYGIVPVFSLWILMLVDCFKRSNLKNKVLWIICLFIFNWVVGVIYFIFIFRKEKINLKIIETFKVNHPNYYNKICLSAIAIALATCQLLFMSIFLTTFGIPFYEIYNLVVNKIIYFPHYLLLNTFYTIANVNTDARPSFGIGLFISLSGVIYTSLLYFAGLILYQRIKQGKCG
jgi:hypothetical protein